MIDVEKQVPCCVWRSVQAWLCRRSSAPFWRVLIAINQIEGRYPDLLPAPPSRDVARKELERAEEAFEWLKSLL